MKYCKNVYSLTRDQILFLTNLVFAPLVYIFTLQERLTIQLDLKSQKKYDDNYLTFDEEI